MNKNNEYGVFLNKYFPYSSMLNSYLMNNIYNRVCENNISTDIFLQHIQYRLTDYRAEVVVSLLDRYKDQFNRILIILPINDIYSSNFYIRSIVESLLKFTYALNFKDNLDKINELGFSDIKESLKSMDIEYKDALDILYSLYGKYSRLIHNKNNYGSELEIMESIIKSSEVDLKNIENDLKHILESYQTIVSNHFKIDECALTTSQKLKIEKRLPKKRVNKFKEKLYPINNL